MYTTSVPPFFRQCVSVWHGVRAASTTSSFLHRLLRHLPQSGVSTESARAGERDQGLSRACVCVGTLNLSRDGSGPRPARDSPGDTFGRLRRERKAHTDAADARATLRARRGLGDTLLALRRLRLFRGPHLGTRFTFRVRLGTTVRFQPELDDRESSNALERGLLAFQKTLDRTQSLDARVYDTLSEPNENPKSRPVRAGAGSYDEASRGLGLRGRSPGGLGFAAPRGEPRRGALRLRARLPPVVPQVPPKLRLFVENASGSQHISLSLSPIYPVACPRL